MEDNRYVDPRHGLLAWLSSRLANSEFLPRVRRKIVGRLPFLVLESEVVDIVYATWLVDAKRARSFAPEGVELWEVDGLTPFTILTYRHRHFGPRVFGALRRLFPSPLQSNWRFYLAEPLPFAPKVTTVVFTKNILDSALYAVGTRLFSDALPSHLADNFKLAVRANDVSVVIDPGPGSAPALSLELERRTTQQLPPRFQVFADSWEELVMRLASQEAAVVAVPSIDRIALATISLPIDLPSIEPLSLKDGTLRCPLLDRLAPLPHAVCFLVPHVRFRALSERLL